MTSFRSNYGVSAGLFCSWVYLVGILIQGHTQDRFLHITIFNCYQVDLRVTADGLAEWQGSTMKTRSGDVTAKTLRQVPIK